jgi:translation initiation factor 3 subunit M
MVVSSTLVNVAEDAELRLVSLLADTVPVASNFQSACETCVSAGDAGQLLQTIVKDAKAISALMVIDATEAVSALSLLAALLERVKTGEEELAGALADAVVKSKGPDGGEKEAATERKIKLLSVLYNMRSEPKEKCALLRRMIQLAGEYPETFLNVDSVLGTLLVEESAATKSLIAPAQPRLVSMMESWDIAESDRRDLFRVVTSVMPDGDKRKQRFLLLLTESYTTSAQVDAQGKQTAKEAAIGAIRDPVSLFINQRTMLTLPAIQALGKDAATAPLLGLLQVFQEGKLSDYQTYCESKGGESKALSPWGLEAESCQRHMKILSLCTLASEHEEIPYSIIATTLQVEVTKVETWVIAAVNSGLLQAKMDQLAQKVMVERCIVRKFDMDQWKALQSRLVLWKQNVGSVLTTLKQSQQAGTTSAVTSN